MLSLANYLSQSARQGRENETDRQTDRRTDGLESLDSSRTLRGCAKNSIK